MRFTSTERNNEWGGATLRDRGCSRQWQKAETFPKGGIQAGIGSYGEFEQGYTQYQGRNRNEAVIQGQ